MTFALRPLGDIVTTGLATSWSSETFLLGNRLIDATIVLYF